MKICYLYNDGIRKNLNASGLDYTPSYISALLAYMGICAQKISSDEICSLDNDDILLIGAERIDNLPECKCILLGGTIGKDCEPSLREEQVFAEFITEKQEALPLFVPVKSAQICGDVLFFARVFDKLLPALVKKDNIYEFTFDLAASVWYSGDGFAKEGPSDYFFIGRTPDTRPIKDKRIDIPYNDILISVLENILSSLGAFSIFRLPPTENADAPDLVINFSGDDDCTSKDFNLEAAITMENYGFPYHINAMPLAGDHFVMNRDEFANICSHGCEIALHTDFTGGVPYCKDSVKKEAELFEKTFGIHPYTNTNHCFIQNGSCAERMRFFYECGILADNGKIGEFDPSDINAFDLCGFGFGSSFPRFTCDDHEHENALIPSLEIPVNYYEPRLYSENSSTEKIVKYIEKAAENARIAQFFIHPHYLAYNSSDRPAVLRVLNTIKNTVEEKKYNLLLSTTNKITSFWLSRASAMLEYRGGKLFVSTEKDILITLPRTLKSSICILDSHKHNIIEKTVNGENLSLVFVPHGSHILEFSSL